MNRDDNKTIILPAEEDRKLDKKYFEEVISRLSKRIDDLETKVFFLKTEED